MNTADVFDKSIWPLYTPGAHWALSDDLKRIGKLENYDTTFADYHIDVNDLPTGKYGLGKCNALADIYVDLYDDYPALMTNCITGASLFINEKCIETVQRTSKSSKIRFTIFQAEDSMLPLFVLNEDSLIVKLHLASYSDVHFIPTQSIRATGMLVNIKSEEISFFVAASNLAVISWDGYQNHVFLHTKKETPDPVLLFTGLNRDADREADRDADHEDREDREDREAVVHSPICLGRNLCGHPGSDDASVLNMLNDAFLNMASDLASNENSTYKEMLDLLEKSDLDNK